VDPAGLHHPLCEAGKYDGDINRKTQNSSNCFQIIKGIRKKKEIPRQCKIIIYKVYFKLMLTYNAKVWILRERRKTKA
jgi:hypothetical protein